MKTNFKVLMTLMDLKIGGGQTHVLELAKGLAKMGVTVFVASNSGVYEKELSDYGIKHITVPLHNKNVFNMIVSYFMLKKIIKENNIRLVHAHARIPAFICGLLHRSLHFRFVTTAHWVFSTVLPFRVLSNWGEEALAVSEDIKQYLYDNYSYPKEKVYVTINGIDLDKFTKDIGPSDVIKEFKLDETKKRILCLSRLDKDRSLAAHKLIECAEAIYAQNKNIEIIIVGSGNDYNEIRRKADALNERLGLKLIYMTGARTDINEFLAASDVVVAVSRSALEAMAAEKPVIMAGNEGYVGFFDESKFDISVETNFCYRGCEQTTADLLRKDLTDFFGFDEQKIKELGSYGRKIIKERYSVDRMAVDALTVYERLLKYDRTNDIVISGFYGFNNHGDEAVLRAIISDLREVRGDLKITVLSRRPKDTAKTYNVNSINRFNYPRIMKELKRSKLLLNGGGSLLQDVTSSRSLWHYLTIINLALKNDTRVMLYANGIGPVQSEHNQKMSAKALDRVNLITLRDIVSVRTLSEMNVKQSNVLVAADPAFSLTCTDQTEGDDLLSRLNLTDKKFIIVSVRNWKYAEKNFAKNILDFCEYIYGKYRYISLFVPMQPLNDAEISKSLAAQMKIGGVYSGDNISINALLSVISKAELVFGMRLHSIIYAIKLGVPVVGLSYDPKVEAIMKEFEQEYYCSVKSIDLDALKSFADFVIVNRSIISPRLLELGVEAEAKSKQNAEMAVALLDEDFF